MVDSSTSFGVEPPEVGVFARLRSGGAKFVSVELSRPPLPVPVGSAVESGSPPVGRSVEVQVRAGIADGQSIDWRTVDVDGATDGLDVAVPDNVDFVEARARFLSGSEPDQQVPASDWSPVATGRFAPQRLQDPACNVPTVRAVAGRGFGDAKYVGVSWVPGNPPHPIGFEVEVTRDPDTLPELDPSVPVVDLDPGSRSAFATRETFGRYDWHGRIDVPVDSVRASVSVRGLGDSSTRSSDWSKPVVVSWDREHERVTDGSVRARDADSGRDGGGGGHDPPPANAFPVRGRDEEAGGADRGDPRPADLPRR